MKKKLKKKKKRRNERLVRTTGNSKSRVKGVVILEKNKEEWEGEAQVVAA